MDLTLDEFAASVGSDGPVTIAGTSTRGGAVAGVEVVSAPAGIVRVDAAEMIVECGAGTPVDEVLGELATVGQTVAVPAGGTIGGALAVGRSDVTRLGHGPMRDVLLQTNYVSAAGKVTKAGGPTVKNVSGFDLCRLMVGSHGTLGFLGDVILRTRPIPPVSRWFTSDRPPAELLVELFRPVSILWDGSTCWVRLDGDPGDVDEAVARVGLVGCDGPPEFPGPYRWSLPPDDLEARLAESQAGTFLAEIGVGVVRHSEPPPARAVPEAIRSLHERIKTNFDPTGRLNPGRSALVGSDVGSDVGMRA